MKTSIQVATSSFFSLFTTQLNTMELHPAVAATLLSHVEPQQKAEQQCDTAQSSSAALPSLPAESTLTYVLFAVTSIIFARDEVPVEQHLGAVQTNLPR